MLEKVKQVRILWQASRACQKGRPIYFQGIRYFDVWDFLDAIVDSGRSFLEVEIDQDDNEGFFVK